LVAQQHSLQVNGRVVHLAVDGAVPLLTVLRNDLGLNGPKYGCGLGQCGACTVLVDGVAARSCALPLAGVAGRAVTTLEGLGVAGALHPVRIDKLHPVRIDKLHPVQRAFITTQAAQCGYCLNGMVMTTVALLRRLPQPSDAQARAALSHNLCRCGTHLEILAAVQLAARLMAEAEAAAAPAAAAAVESGPAG
jgi:nicotinate dehydrogenase subunit A